VWTWTAAFLALASMVGICVYRYAEVWTPLERFYVTTYIRSGLRSLVKFSRTDSYWTVSAVGKKGSHWALDEEVMQIKTGTGETMLALTPEAVQIGDVRLSLEAHERELCLIRMHGALEEYLAVFEVRGDIEVPLLQAKEFLHA